ncbi:MAG: AAA family ATPase [Gemmataceae bacterium]
MTQFRANALAAALVRAQQHWDQQHSRPKKEEEPAWSIAITRQAGANAPKIAQEVGAHLGWPVYDHQLVEHIAEDHGLRVRLLDTVDEKTTSWIRDCIESFGLEHGVTLPGYVRYLVETLHTLSKHGHCVLVGRGAAQVLPPETTLRVRLIGSLHDRVQSISDRHGISPQEAKDWVDKKDRERNKFVRDHFHKDPNDPNAYDLTLNSHRYSVKECAEMIVKALHAAEQKSLEKHEAVRA